MTGSAKRRVVAWRILIPRLVSNGEHAPLLGEAGILYQLTTVPAPGTPTRHHTGSLPAIVFVFLGIYFAVGAVCLRIAWRVAKPLWA